MRQDIETIHSARWMHTKPSWRSVGWTLGRWPDEAANAPSANLKTGASPAMPLSTPMDFGVVALPKPRLDGR